MSERTDVSAAFGLRLATDLLTGLVLTGVIPKNQATALVSDARNALLQSEPAELQPRIEETAATLTAQIEVVHAMLQERLRREGLGD